MSNYDIIANDLSHVYLNLNSYNSSKTTSFQAVIKQDFTEPIINHPSDYQVAVVKAQIPTANIPLNNFQTVIQGTAPYPPNPFTYLCITFTHAGIDYQRYVQWDDSFNIGFSETARFFLYSYLQFNTLVNRTLKLLTNDVNTAVGSTILPAPPVIAFEPLDQLFNFQAPKQFTVDPTSPFYTDTKIYFNDLLYNYMYTQLFYKYDNTSLLKSYQMFVGELYPFTGSGLNILTRNGIDYYYMIQEFPSTENFNSARSIIIQSNLPTISQYINQVTSGDPINNTIQLPILTELAIDSKAPLVTTYIPTSEYRMSDLSSNQPINNISLQFFWQDKSGLILPIFIPEVDTISIKILFRKKTWMNSGLYALQSLPEEERKKVNKVVTGGGYGRIGRR